MYLGTNRGLYYTSYPVRLNGNLPDIHPIPQSSGQVWNLCKIGDDLFCLHDRGIFQIKGTNMYRITDITGAWYCQEVMGYPDRMYVGVYNGLYLLEKQSGEWRVLCKIDGFQDSCRLFEQESAKVLWIYNSGSITRVELSEELTRQISVKSYGV